GRAGIGHLAGHHALGIEGDRRAARRLRLGTGRGGGRSFGGRGGGRRGRRGRGRGLAWRGRGRGRGGGRRRRLGLGRLHQGDHRPGAQLVADLHPQVADDAVEGGGDFHGGPV